MSRTKETKLIMESWRKFMNEAESSASKNRETYDVKYGTSPLSPEDRRPTSGTPAKEITNPEAKRLPNNFRYNSAGKVVHVDNGMEANDRHYKDLSEPQEGFQYDEVGNLIPIDIPPGDFEYDEAGNLVHSDTVEAGSEDQLSLSGEEFMRRFDLPKEEEEDLSNDPHLSSDDF